MRVKVFLLLLVLPILVEGQNLVPNPSFEHYTSCPTSDGMIYLASPWQDPSTGSSDYFNECSSSNQASVPTSIFGHRWPRTGKGYVGIGTYQGPVTPNAREFIEVQLTDSLKKGVEYCIGFYVSLGENTWYASNGLSAYLSNNYISCSGCLLPFVPQINYLGPPIKDTLNWFLVSGNYIAIGGEQYITIGNFNTDSNTKIDTVNPTGSGGGAAYYYIDDVYVGTCDTIKPPPVVSSLTIPNVFTPNNDQQNDVFSISSNNLQSLNCQIFNRWGVKVWELTTPLESWDGHDKTGIPCSEGVYFYVLHATGTDSRVYHQTGFIQLSR